MEFASTRRKGTGLEESNTCGDATVTTKISSGYTIITPVKSRTHTVSASMHPSETGEDIKVNGEEEV